MNELMGKYGQFFITGIQFQREANQSSEPLSKSVIPQTLWPLIPYAEFWGISDDGYRIDLIDAAPSNIWIEFRESVFQHLNELENWLIGPDAKRQKKTREYIAFSSMLEAYHWPRKV